MSTTPTRAKRRRQVRIASKLKVPLPPQLQRVNLNAAGVDIGSEEHWAAVPPGRDREGQDVRRFGAFSGDLCALADWLQRCEIETVAMESTGVYWIALYELLVERGFEVLLVDARRVRNVPGRKTDVLDCQWLQELHTYGLLRGAFRPADQVCVLRSYLRQRSMLVAYASHHIQHMQKALEQMNLKLAHVVSDITGVTGMGIIKAILGGERDPVKLAKLRDPRCKSSEATVARALEGTTVKSICLRSSKPSNSSSSTSAKLPPATARSRPASNSSRTGALRLPSLTAPAGAGAAGLPSMPAATFTASRALISPKSIASKRTPL